MGGHCSTGQSPQWAVVPMEGGGGGGGGGDISVQKVQISRIIICLLLRR